MRQNTKRTFQHFWGHIQKFKIFAFIAVFSVACAIALELAVPYLYKIFFDALTESKDAAGTSALLIKIIITRNLDE